MKAFEVVRQNQQTIRALEGLRGVAVFLVFLVHFSGQVQPWLAKNSATAWTAQNLNFVGNFGVDLFFVLSGYLIYGALIKKPTAFLPYLARRVQRIYPTFLCVLGLYLILSFLFPAENKLPPDVGNALVYVLQNVLLLPGIFDIQPIITVAWSLSYEFFFYLAVPILIAVLQLRKWHWRARAGFFLASSIVGFGYFYFFTGHFRFLMFVCGMILFEAAANSRFKLPRFSGLAAFAASLAVLILMVNAGVGGWWQMLAVYVLFFAFCFESLTRADGSAASLSFAPLRWLGNISYSYYLIHGLTLKAFFLLLAVLFPPTAAHDGLFWLLLIPAFALTLAPAVALFLLVEKPFSFAAPPKKSADANQSAPPLAAVAPESA